MGIAATACPPTQPRDKGHSHPTKHLEQKKSKIEASLPSLLALQRNSCLFSTRNPGVNYRHVSDSAEEGLSNVKLLTTPAPSPESVSSFKLWGCLNFPELQLGTGACLPAATKCSLGAGARLSPVPPTPCSPSTHQL